MRRRNVDWSKNDEQLHHISDVESSMENMVIRIGVHSYNEGPPKISLMRTGERKDGTRWYRGLGRLTLEEASCCWAALDEFMERLRKAGVITDDAISNKRFAKWLAKHGEPLEEDEVPKKRREKDDDEDDDEDEKPRKSRRHVEDDDEEPEDEKPAKKASRKLHRPLPRR